MNKAFVVSPNTFQVREAKRKAARDADKEQILDLQAKVDEMTVELYSWKSWWYDDNMAVRKILLCKILLQTSLMTPR